MDRRLFSKQLITGIAFSTVSPLAFASSPAFCMKKKTIKPKRLKKGQTIGLIAPGSSVTESKFQNAILHIEKLGFVPAYTKNIMAKKGYLAGDDMTRLADLHQMFGDPKIDAVWCIRGGYGCTRLLHKIDYKLISKHPKILIGYSDITALIQAIYKKTGLIGFHGPVAVSEPTDYTLEYFEKVLMSNNEKIILKNAGKNLSSEEKNFQPKVIQKGKARGKLTGGNLSLISALAGTKYQLPVKNKILFLEDVGEKPYRIDRMLTQLRQSCKLEEASAIVLGIFAGCEGGENSLTLMETLEDRLSDLNIPVIYGMSFGHIDHQFTLPVGIKAEIDTDTQKITLLESSVV